MTMPWGERAQTAETAIGDLLKRLPPPIRARAEEITLVLEKRPGRNLGVEPDILGLFEGQSLRDPDSTAVELSPRITLFLDNILDESGPAPATFIREVRDTYLHELGHYLGLEEDDLDLRGLA